MPAQPPASVIWDFTWIFLFRKIACHGGRPVRRTATATGAQCRLTFIVTLCLKLLILGCHSFRGPWSSTPNAAANSLETMADER